jgi:hypothetical protein
MRRLATVVLAASLLSATPALAQESTARGGHDERSVVAWGILGWGSAVGLGATFQLPLVPQGLIHDPGFRLRDSLDLDVGVDYLSYWNHYHSGVYNYDVSEFNLHAGVIWNFWVTPKLAVYPKAALGYGIARYSGNWDPGLGHGSYGGLYPELAVGAQWKLANTVSLRSELGWAGLKLGVGFAF